MISVAVDWLCNWNNVTRVIAITGLAISLYNLLFGIITRRRSFKICIYDIKSYLDITYLFIGIENRSQLSIAITQISLCCGGTKKTCTPLPTLLHEDIRTKGEILISRKQIYSTQLPITVAGLSAQSAFVLFEYLTELPKNDATFLTVEVCTNRGRSAQMKIELPQGWASRRTPS